MATAGTNGRDRPAVEAVTAIVGGTVVTEATVFDATVLVAEDGSISGLVAPSVHVSASTTIDASGLHVFPGGIDTHSHFNDPGLTASEDFLSGTSGAAAGGYTTILEMPQTEPLVDSVETFQAKLEAIAPKAVVDFGLYAALVPDTSRSEALTGLAEAGAIAVKGFACASTQMPTLTETDLVRGLRNASQLGLPVAIHCESQPSIDAHTERVRAAGAHDVHAVADAHPLEAEKRSVRSVLALTEEVGGNLHLVHMSHPATVELADQAKLRGVRVSVETCPHYLVLTRDHMNASGEWALCFPPLRTADAVEGLWQALSLGRINAIGSDHCAYTFEQKINDDPWEVRPGINGIQITLPVLVDGAVKRGIPLNAIVKAFSADPARNFSLHPSKGDIRPGADADIVLVEIGGSETVARAADWYSRCPGTVWEGMSFGARVRRTLVRGVTTYVDDGRGQIVVSPGSGRFIHGERARSVQSLG
jgi:allantoinase